MSAPADRLLARGRPVSLPPRWTATHPREAIVRRRATRALWIGLLMLALSGGGLYLADVLVDGWSTRRVADIGYVARDRDGTIEFEWKPNHPTGIRFGDELHVFVQFETRGHGVFDARGRHSQASIEIWQSGSRFWTREQRAQARQRVFDEVDAKYALSDGERRALERGSRVDLPPMVGLVIVEFGLSTLIALSALTVVGAFGVLVREWRRRIVRAWVFSRDAMKCRKCKYELAGLPIGTGHCPECNARLYPLCSHAVLPLALRVKRGMPVSTPPRWVMPKSAPHNRDLVVLCVAIATLFAMAFMSDTEQAGVREGFELAGRVAFLTFAVTLPMGGIPLIASVALAGRLEWIASHEPQRCRKCKTWLRMIEHDARECPGCGARLYPFYAPRREGVS